MTVGMVRENQYPIIDVIPPQHILLSVFDKRNLGILVQGIIACNPDARFYSTGGTGKSVLEALGDKSETNYTSVEDFTGSPEMEGGLVKTLHPKVHAGLLAERGNPEHERFLNKISGVYFDMMVGNFYPFEKEIRKEGVTTEQARANIDIGGPTMVMAAAKNWQSCAPVAHPLLYKFVLDELEEHGGITAEGRYRFMGIAIRRVAKYRNAIAQFFKEKKDFDKDVRTHLEFVGDEK